MGKTAATHGNGVRADIAASVSFPGCPRALPPDVRSIVIVGAGGFGREVLQWARDTWPEDCDRINGFLSADVDILDGFDCGVGIIGTPDSYRPAAGEKFIFAIGVPYVRRRVAESMAARGAEFLTLIHPTALVAPSARIGGGSVICPYSIVSNSASVGRFVAMNYHSSLGHDASAGDFAVLSPYAALGGGATIEDDVFLGMHAAVSPGKNIGFGSKVSANTCASHHAPANSLIYGVPCRIGPTINVTESYSIEDATP